MVGTKWKQGLFIGVLGGALVAGVGMRAFSVAGGEDRDPGPTVADRQGPERLKETLLAELERGLERWYQGDPSGYADLYAEELSYFDPGTVASLDGIEALRAFYAPLEGEISVDRWEIVDDRLQLPGDAAVLTFLLNEYVGSDSPTTVWKVTHVYQHLGGGWRVIHGHFSQAE